MNGQRITHKQILPGDILRLGSVEIIVLDPRRSQESEQATAMNATPWRLVSDSRWLPNKTFLISATGPVILGRTKDCDITIPGTHIARQHTEFQVRGSQLFIKDLGSASGTFLNEKAITLSEARSGDKLRLDVFTFHLIAPGAELTKAQLHASIDSISKPIERKQISTEPKRWKTRPTSPGNRIEPSEEKPRRKLGKWLIFAGFVAVFVMIARKFLW